MAIYVYHCPTCDEDFEEMWRGPEDYMWPCPICGTNSKRNGCSGLPAIRGETVGASYTSSRAIDPKGRYRLSDFQEAGEEVADGYDRIEKREGRKVNRPDLYKRGLKNAARMGAKIRRK